MRRIRALEANVPVGAVTDAPRKLSKFQKLASVFTRRNDEAKSTSDEQKANTKP
ncbi:hypothetical protein PMIN07_006291 [Paraphaeosphaeria minitans]